MVRKSTKSKPQEFLVGNPKTDFLLKGKDWSSPAVILIWMALNVNTASDEKLKSAFEIVLETRKVPGRKVAD